MSDGESEMTCSSALGDVTFTVAFSSQKFTAENGVLTLPSMSEEK